MCCWLISPTSDSFVCEPRAERGNTSTTNNFSASFLCPCRHLPDNQRNGAVEDGCCRPEHPRKNRLACFLLIAKAYDHRLLILGHDNHYTFNLLQFGEIGLKLAGHLQTRRQYECQTRSALKSVT